VSVLSDPKLSAEVEALARVIAGEQANPELQELARRVAEAQIDLIRVRRARHDLIAAALGDPNYKSAHVRSREIKNVAIALRRCLGPDRYINESLLRLIEPEPKPEGPNKFATILSDVAQRLATMDHYERRALSRRKFAIRDFDAAQRRGAFI
jgi:hypothetical protein